jgi:hypothetical protein
VARFSTYGVFALALTFGAIGTGLAESPPLLDNDSCKTCHRAEWKEWKASRHSVAGNNPTFTFEYSAHPGNWCLQCHAPRMGAEETLKKKRAMAQGVDCLTCHVKQGQLISSSHAAHSPHDTKVMSDFGDAKSCATCHQFNFPELDERGELVRYTDQPMQNTAAEFFASEMAKNGAECTDCHMPAGSHQFPGAYEPHQVRKALATSLCKTSNALQVQIKNALLAHNLPSGGINRAIVLNLWPDTQSDRTREYRLERLFKGPIGRRGKHKDTTLEPGQEAIWSIPISLLTPPTPRVLHLRSQFYFGTDPNRHRPVSKITIDKTSVKWSQVPSCSPD